MEIGESQLLMANNADNLWVLLEQFFDLSLSSLADFLLHRGILKLRLV